MPAVTSNAACSQPSAAQPRGIVQSPVALAISENHSTMVADFSVWTSLRTSKRAIADIAAPPSAAATPSASLFVKPASVVNKVSFGHEMISTPNSPTTTALQR